MSLKKKILCIVLCVLLCIALCVTSVVLTTKILNGKEESEENVTRVAEKTKTRDEDDELEDDEPENDEVEYKNSEKTKEKTRLTRDGVDYLVSDGKLIITGEGTVTKSAVSELLPKFNTVDFESGMFDIGDGAFEGYTNITDVSFRNNVGNIGNSAFKGTSLALVCFGESIEDIGKEAFSDCCIDYVLINNANIYANFDSRYDMGEVALTAPNVYVYKEIFDLDDASSGAAGNYLAVSKVYDDIKKAVAGKSTAAGYNYAFDNYVDKTGFIALYGDTLLRNWMSAEYTPGTNMLEYHFYDWDDPWKGRNIVRYDEADDSEDDAVTTKSNDTTKKTNTTKKENSTKVKSTPNSVTNNVKSGSDCYICGGTGSKQCTSCHGQGYYYEYDNYGAAGDGGKLTQIKKTCMVCHGSGKVKCYH